MIRSYLMDAKQHNAFAPLSFQVTDKNGLKFSSYDIEAIWAARMEKAKSIMITALFCVCLSLTALWYEPLTFGLEHVSWLAVVAMLSPMIATLPFFMSVRFTEAGRDLAVFYHLLSQYVIEGKESEVTRGTLNSAIRNVVMRLKNGVKWHAQLVPMLLINIAIMTLSMSVAVSFVIPVILSLALSLLVVIHNVQFSALSIYHFDEMSIPEMTYAGRDEDLPTYSSAEMFANNG